MLSVPLSVRLLPKHLNTQEEKVTLYANPIYGVWAQTSSRGNGYLPGILVFTCSAPSSRRLERLGRFRFDYEYDYDYEIRHFGPSRADVITDKVVVIVCLRTSFEENVVLK